MQRTHWHVASPGAHGAPAGEAYESAHPHGAWARLMNALLGAWLFASAMILPRTTMSGGTAFILGMLIVVMGVWGLWTPLMRRFNSAAALFVLVTAVVLPHVAMATRLHDVLVAGAAFLFSLVPNQAVRTRSYI